AGVENTGGHGRPPSDRPRAGPFRSVYQGISSAVDGREELLRSALVCEPRGHFPPPFGHRPEAGPTAAERLRLRQDRGFAALEVERLADGLAHVPWRIGEDLYAIAFGIAEIDRPGIAVRDGDEIGRSALADAVPEGDEIAQRIDAEGKLIDDPAGKPGGTPFHQHELMMLARLARQKGEERPAQPTLVGYDKSEPVAVELEHAGHVGDEEPDIAEAQRGGRSAHPRRLRRPMPIPSRNRRAARASRPSPHRWARAPRAPNAPRCRDRDRQRYRSLPPDHSPAPRRAAAPLG